MDRPALAAGAAPGVADPAQPFTTEFAVEALEAYWANRDVVEHRASMRPPRAERQCIACGVVGDCDPSRPCAACGASSFHLIPLRP